MSLLLETKDKVQRYLAELGEVTLTNTGGYTMRNGSARIFVNVEELGDDQTWVSLVSPVLIGVNNGPELHEYVAFNSDNLKYGAMSLHKDDEGVDLFLGYGLLGTTLDPDELKLAVVLLTQSADKLDDELKGRFGGRRFHDE